MCFSQDREFWELGVGSWELAASYVGLSAKLNTTVGGRFTPNSQLRTPNFLDFFTIVATRKRFVSGTRRSTAGIDIGHQIDFDIAAIAVWCLFDFVDCDI
jgi:hypothetical protein